MAGPCVTLHGGTTVVSGGSLVRNHHAETIRTGEKATGETTGHRLSHVRSRAAAAAARCSNDGLSVTALRVRVGREGGAGMKLTVRRRCGEIGRGARGLCPGLGLRRGRGTVEAPRGEGWQEGLAD